MPAKIFKPTYLYIKTHNVTGLKYFGKTSEKDPVKYKGSGTRWLNHIKVHGYDVTTEIVGYYVDEEECRKVALDFSVKNNIAESKEWANLMDERMDGGPVNSESIEKLKATQIRTQGGVMAKAREASRSKASHSKRMATLQEKYGSKCPHFNQIVQTEEFKQALRQRMSGNTVNKGRTWVHRGAEKRMIYPADLEQFLSEGWVRGYKD